MWMFTVIWSHEGIYQKTYARFSVFSYPSSSELMVVGSSTGSGIFPLILPFENGLP